jgi:hypothetical protein
MKNKTNKNIRIVVFLILFLISIGIIIYFLKKNNTTNKNKIADSYMCKPKYINDSFDIFLTWSLITNSNIKYDNFTTYRDSNGNNTAGIISITYNQFQASINVIDKYSFDINIIKYDNIDSGIKPGMTFKYKENKKNNSDIFNYTWYEVENTNIKLIANIDCPIKPIPQPIEDKSMKCNPKCSQILESSPIDKRCDLTLISDKSSYEGTINWSITSNEGKKYDGFTIKYEKDTFNFYNNNDKNFKMSLNYGIMASNIPDDIVILPGYRPGDIFYTCVFIKDTMNLGIKISDSFILDLENNYVCLRGNINLPNIKIFPTKCYNI